MLADCRQRRPTVHTIVGGRGHRFWRTPAERVPRHHAEGERDQRRALVQTSTSGRSRRRREKPFTETQAYRQKRRKAHRRGWTACNRRNAATYGEGHPQSSIPKRPTRSPRPLASSD